MKEARLTELDCPAFVNLLEYSCIVQLFWPHLYSLPITAPLEGCSWTCKLHKMMMMIFAKLN